MSDGAPEAADAPTGWRGLAARLALVAAGPPLVPPVLRRPLIALSVLAVGLLAGLGFPVHHSRRPILFDASLGAFLARSGGREHRLAWRLSQVGDPKVFVTITLVVVLVLAVVGDRRAALSAVASVAAAVVLIENVLKPVVHRDLAGMPSPVFPSGHTGVSLALAGVVVLAARNDRPLGRLLGRLLGRWGGRLVMAGALATGVTIGVAMIVLRFHYPTDVVAAAPLGLAVSGWTARAVDAAVGAVARAGAGLGRRR